MVCRGCYHTEGQGTLRVSSMIRFDRKVGRVANFANEARREGAEATKKTRRDQPGSTMMRLIGWQDASDRRMQVHPSAVGSCTRLQPALDAHREIGYFDNSGPVRKWLASGMTFNTHSLPVFPPLKSIDRAEGAFCSPSTIWNLRCSEPSASQPAISASAALNSDA
jgi:hypothetical protein